MAKKFIWVWPLFALRIDTSIIKGTGIPCFQANNKAMTAQMNFHRMKQRFDTGILKNNDNFKDFVKSPAGEFSEGISDGYGGDQMGSTTAAGLVTSTSSSLLVGDKDKAQTQKKEKQHKEKKKRTKKMGNGVKNDEGKSNFNNLEIKF